jgi:hypothetical protein
VIESTFQVTFKFNANGWRVFGAESASFGVLLILVRLTPVTPNLVEFFGEKRRELVIGISLATGNDSS